MYPDVREMTPVLGVYESPTAEEEIADLAVVLARTSVKNRFEPSTKLFVFIKSEEVDMDETTPFVPHNNPFTEPIEPPKPRVDVATDDQLTPFHDSMSPIALPLTILLLGTVTVQFGSVGKQFGFKVSPGEYIADAYTTPTPKIKATKKPAGADDTRVFILFLFIYIFIR